SQKAYVVQLTSIEHCQEHIHHIQVRLITSSIYPDDLVQNTPYVHHLIGQIQISPDNLSAFQQHNSDDPTVQGFIPELKAHILPHIRAMYIEGSES
ncbi:hypothetical protein PAXRUDRAFT_63484, partial [Paxillus rubicundulus Ve08.2h10]